MEQSKLDILSELYAVRSVLSIVSQNEDNVNYIINNEINPRNRTIDSILRTNISRNNDIENMHRYECSKPPLEEEIRKNQSIINDCVKDISTSKDKINRSRSSYIQSLIGRFFLGFLVTMIPVGLVMTVVIYIIMMFAPAESYSVISGVSVSVVWVIASIIYAFRKSSHYLKNIKNEKIIISNLDESIADSKSKIIKCESKIDEINSKINSGDIYTQEGIKLKEEIKKDEGVIAGIKKKINECIDKIQEIKSKSEQLIVNAKKVYQILDFRDWENIDLIIFYFETGRADSLKEALYQVDRERQSQGIIGAIHSASSVLCRTINSSIAELSAKLNKSFEKLSQSLNEQSIRTRAVIEDNLSKSTALLKRQSEQTTKLIQSNYSSQEMNRALLEKISTSSDKLVMDMESQLRANGIPYCS